MQSAAQAFAEAPEESRHEAFNRLYDAAINYVRSAYPDHRCLRDDAAQQHEAQQNNAPVMDDEGGARLAALVDEIQRLGGNRGRTPPGLVAEDGLPPLVTAILDYRPCVARSNPPITHAHNPVVVSNNPQRSLPMFQPVAVANIGPSNELNKLDRLLREIAHPGPVQRLLTPHAGARAVRKLKEHLDLRTTSREEYIGQRAKRDYALVGLRRIIVSDPPSQVLNFKNPALENQIMRLLARYLSPGTALDINGLSLPSYVRQLHRGNENPQIILSESARMEILTPLLGASHALDMPVARRLMSMAMDNISDVRKVGKASERFALIGSIVRAFNKNVMLEADPRNILSNGSMLLLANIVMEMSETLVHVREQVDIDHQSYRSALQGLADDLKIFRVWADELTGNVVTDTFPQLSQAIERIASTYTWLQEPPPDYHADNSPPTIDSPYLPPAYNQDPAPNSQPT